MATFKTCVHPLHHGGVRVTIGEECPIFELHKICDAVLQEKARALWCWVPQHVDGNRSQVSPCAVNHTHHRLATTPRPAWSLGMLKRTSCAHCAFFRVCPRAPSRSPHA